MHGALIVTLSILAGFVYSLAHHLDGAQTFIVCCFAWLFLSALYHGARAFVPVRPIIGVQTPITER